MLKQIMIGLVTVVALTAYASTDAMARGGGFGGGGGFHGGGGGGFHGGGGGGFRGGGFQGGGFRGAAVQGGGFRGVGSFAMGGARFAAIRGTGFHGNFGHGRHFRRFAPFVVGFGLPYYYNNYYDDLYYANYGYDGCFRVIRVHTRYGWRWRQVNICG